MKQLADWKCNLHNIFNFLRLRLDSHAQLEIRLYAQAMYELIKPVCPVACEAFEDYRLKGVQFSVQELDIIQKLVDNVRLGMRPAVFDRYLKESNLSKRELTEFKKKLEL